MVQVGELIAGRYEVKATHGKGVFSTVLLARDRSHPEDHPLATVAIKVRACMQPLSLGHELLWHVWLGPAGCPCLQESCSRAQPHLG